MARLFTCGFEENDLLNTMWTATGGTAPTIGRTAPHSGTYRLNTGSNAGQSWVRNAFTNRTTGHVYTRCDVSTSSVSPSADLPIAQLWSGALVASFQVVLRTTGVLQLKNAISATTVNGTTSLTINTWYRVETDLFISDTVGTVTLRLYNDAGGLLETIVNDGPGHTGEDTLPVGIAGAAFGKLTGTQTLVLSFDDIAINDESGSSQNSWPGPGKVALVAPASNTSVTWLNEAGGSADFNKIDEATGQFVASNFSGSSQYLTFADNAAHDLTAAGAFTIAAVARTNTIASTVTFVSHCDATAGFGWRFMIDAGGHIVLEACGLWGADGTATTDLSVTTWYGIAATRPAASAIVTYWRFRLDLQTMASETVNMGVSSYNDGAVLPAIGAMREGGAYIGLWNGQIARVGIDVGTAHTSQELTDFFNGLPTTSWDSRWDLPSLTDTGTAGATLTNSGTVSNDALFNATTSTTNEDKFALTSLTSEVPSNATMTLIDVYARVSAPDAVSGTMALKVWDDAGTGTQGPTMTVSSATPRILTTTEHQVASLAGKTKNDISAYSIGYKAVSGASRKGVMAEWANVEWTEGTGTTALTGSVSTSGRGTSVPGIEVPL